MSVADYQQIVNEIEIEVFREYFMSFIFFCAISGCACGAGLRKSHLDKIAL